MCVSLILLILQAQSLRGALSLFPHLTPLSGSQHAVVHRRARASPRRRRQPRRGRCKEEAAKEESQLQHRRGELSLPVAVGVVITLPRLAHGESRPRAAADRRRTRQDKEYREHYATCETSVNKCGHLHPETKRPPCVLKCMSTQCYQQIYGQDEVPRHMTPC
jgi:hypothetical protein